MKPEAIVVYGRQDAKGKMHGPYSGKGESRGRWYTQKKQAENACRQGDQVLRGVILWEDDGRPAPDPFLVDL